MYKSRSRSLLQETSNFSVVADTRRKTDSDLDEAEPHAVPHVLELNSEAKAVIGLDYHNAQRIALFEYACAERAPARDRSDARADLRRELLAGRSPGVTVIIPTAAFTENRDPQKAETIAWGAFGAPDSLAAMRGCMFTWAPATSTRAARYVMPIHAPSPQLKELQKWENAHFLRCAVSFNRLLSCDPLAKPLEPYRIAAGQTSSPNLRMVSYLDAIRTGPHGVAVDIESIEESGTITAIGLSDGIRAVSVNWEPFTPHGGGGKREPGLLGDTPGIQEIAQLVEDILKENKPKVFHNHTFDVPRLQAKGLRVGGTIEDTFAASAIAHPELKHGLQAACATCIPEVIPPWKSLWHPKITGVSRDDIEYWTCDPAALYDYNARDAFYTWHLAKAVLPQAGRKWA